jgi:hypothetical protein
MEKITDKLDNINNTLEKMLKAIEKSEHPMFKFLTIAGMLAGIFSIIIVIDTILNWF